MSAGLRRSASYAGLADDYNFLFRYMRVLEFQTMGYGCHVCNLLIRGRVIDQ